MITDGELDRLLEASSPYLRDPGEGISMRAETDLHRMLEGRTVAPARPTRRTWAWAASAIAVASVVAILAVAVPVVTGLGRAAAPDTAGVPVPGPAPTDGTQPVSAQATGTLLSLDGSTSGEVEVDVEGDSITVRLIDLDAIHDELIATGELMPGLDRLCLDTAAPAVEFGSFDTVYGTYTWLVVGSEHDIPWTALREFDLAAFAPGAEEGTCETTIVARAVLTWQVVDGDVSP
ncbi:hypothetical protein [Microbacterium hominis]|uniref:Uncharacterized protein n=1 Tax=Microbacterium hominis TaxID=162426 RepID=A0A7D4QA39_9MICO|nr:hypothetical protein [Microbacterium hominis]QKJ20959.1 hypothetical protein HQM25_17380 [Microbacterium hominis]